MIGGKLRLDSCSTRRFLPGMIVTSICKLPIGRCDSSAEGMRVGGDGRHIHTARKSALVGALHSIAPQLQVVLLHRAPVQARRRVCIRAISLRALPQHQHGCTPSLRLLSLAHPTSSPAVRMRFEVHGSF